MSERNRGDLCIPKINRPAIHALVQRQPRGSDRREFVERENAIEDNLKTKPLKCMGEFSPLSITSR